jgi:hypothetical protein
VIEFLQTFAVMSLGWVALEAFLIAHESHATNDAAEGVCSGSSVRTIHRLIESKPLRGAGFKLR